MGLNTETYDVVIVGGAMMGSAVAWSLISNADFTGKICIIEKDPTYEFASTSRSNSCIRQQYSNELNVRISKYGAEYIRNFKDFIRDEDAPDITFQDFGYMYFADSEAAKEVFKQNQKVIHES